MTYCVAFGCKSNSRKKEEGVTFHRFPLGDSAKLNDWVANLMLYHFIPKKNHRICSKHFEDNYFYRTSTGKVKLLNQAVPTIFEDQPEVRSKFVQPKTRPIFKTPREIRAEKRTSSCADQPEDKPSTSRTVEAEESPSLINHKEIKQLKHRLDQEKFKSAVKSKKIKVLKQKLLRYEKRITSLKSILKELRGKHLLLEEHSVLFEEIEEEMPVRQPSLTEEHSVLFEVIEEEMPDTKPSLTEEHSVLFEEIEEEMPDTKPSLKDVVPDTDM